MQKEQQLMDFKLTRVLQNSPESQTLVLLANDQVNFKMKSGYFDDEQLQAVMILKKKPFSGDYNNNLHKVIKSEQYFEVIHFLKRTFQLIQLSKNDIFKRFKVELQSDDWNEIDLQMIFPATQKLIDKYTKSDSIIVVETPEIYNNIVKGFIDEVKTNSLQWLYNILEGKAEQERILYNDPHPQDGFIILPNFNFSDFSQTQQLYVLGISQRRDIQSLRDLDGSHIGLLEKMLKQGEQIIKEKFQVPKNKLRVFIHYQPTYYHFHVHFTHVEVLESSMNCDRSHPLHQVIHNLKTDPNYYKKAVLMYSIQSTIPLYNKLKQITEQESNQ